MSDVTDLKIGEKIIRRDQMDPSLPELSFDRSALMLLDMQNEFLNPDGVFARKGLLQPLTPGERDELIFNATSLLEALRQGGRPVIYLKTAFRSDHADCFLSPPWRECLNDQVSCLVKGSRSAAVIDELQPESLDFVVTKKGHSAFQHTYLDRLLGSLDVDTCILLGNLLGSVEETAGQAGALGYDCFLAVDSCYPRRSPYLEGLTNTVFLKSTRELVATIRGSKIKPESRVYKPALLIVDLQNDPFHPEGIGHRLGFKKVTDPERDEIVRNNQRLAAAMRAQGCPIIYIRLIKRVRGLNGNLDHALCKVYMRNRPVPRGIDRSTEGTWGSEILDELQPQDGDFVLTKKSQGAFGTTHLHRLLRNLGVNLLLVTGGSVTGCLAGTTREGIGLGYRAIVVADATYSPSKRGFGLPALANRGAEIHTTDHVLSRLARAAW